MDFPFTVPYPHPATPTTTIRLFSSHIRIDGVSREARTRTRPECMYIRYRQTDLHIRQPQPGQNTTKRWPVVLQWSRNTLTIVLARALILVLWIKLTRLSTQQHSTKLFIPKTSRLQCTDNTPRRWRNCSAWTLTGGQWPQIICRIHKTPSPPTLLGSCKRVEKKRRRNKKGKKKGKKKKKN